MFWDTSKRPHFLRELIKLANPQVENGHIRIANEIWDALVEYRLPGEQMQCLMFVLRKTYGWGKIEDYIPLSQFAKATGISRPGVARAVRRLVSKKILLVVKNDNTITKYRFNKDFKEWAPVIKKDTVIKKDNTSVIKKDTLNNQLKPISVSVKNNTYEVLSKKITGKNQKPIDLLRVHIQDKLKIPMTRKDDTENMLKTYDLETLKSAVDRMARYFEQVKFYKWRKYVLGRHWGNLLNRIGEFMTDDDLNVRLENTCRYNKLPDSKPLPTNLRVSDDLSEEERIYKMQREQRIQGDQKCVPN